MNKQVLITGASGQLGSALYSQLATKFNLILTDLNGNSDESILKLDITNHSELDIFFSKYAPEIVINLAAFTDVDRCEQQPDLAQEVNYNSVKLLAKYCSCRFIQISTDYVFDGKNGPYGEEDKTSPINIYGKTKLAAEKFVEQNFKDWCILRTNVLFDYQKGTKASFIKWIIDSLKNGQKINVVDDQFNNPTWTNDFAKIIRLVIERDMKGLYHYGGADYLNRYDFALMIAEAFNLDYKLINPIKTIELNQLAKRPLKGGLKTDKIEQALNVKSNKLQDNLLEIKSRMN